MESGGAVSDLGAYCSIVDENDQPISWLQRVSAGGVADEWVTQMLRQGDAQVFKKFSQMKLQMKLQMKREALEKLSRRASEMASATGERMRTVMVQ
ncbi:MAG TPA: hypothetical protein VF845_03055 [Terriglobales bacterium]